MNQQHREYVPRFYVFVVEERSPPHKTLQEGMARESNYKEVWDWFIGQYREANARLMVHELMTDGSGVRFVKQVNCPQDLEDL